MDEFTLGEKLGAVRARAEILQPHWNTWITLSDFKRIAKAGFNVMRLPVGFWAYDNTSTPYAAGAAPYVDKAIQWARETKLKVIIDLHGAPGSQNGFDNSGHRKAKPKWQTGNNVQRTLDILRIIQSKYGAPSYDDVIAGIELLNEPLIPKLNYQEVKNFERRGYQQQRQFSGSRVIVIQDGFEAPSSYNGWLTPSDHNSQWVALDHHEYQVFDNNLVGMLPWQHRQFVCNNAGTYSGADKWTFVGEWSAAMTDCAAALNGYGIGARYDGTYPNSTYHGSCNGVNNIASWSQTFKDDTRGYIEAQMETFEARTQGWIFWTWRTEGSGEWDASRLIEAGIFPQPLTSRKLGAICDNN